LRTSCAASGPRLQAVREFAQGRSTGRWSAPCFLDQSGAQALVHRLLSEAVMTDATTTRQGLLHGLRTRWRRWRGKSERQTAASDAAIWIPDLEVSLRETELAIMFDLPGVRSNDLEIEATPDRLTVKGWRGLEEPARGDHVHVRERPHGRFAWSLVLPEGSEIDRITSELLDGVLTIVVPLARSHRKIAIATQGS
jgi:HSP20 family molecular chaperone IbpA